MFLEVTVNISDQGQQITLIVHDLTAKWGFKQDTGVLSGLVKSAGVGDEQVIKGPAGLP